MLISDLCILIPTYNRPNKLLFLVNKLNNLNSFDVPIVILDNCSNEPVIELLQNNDCLNKNISVKRNIANVGGNFNVFSCFLNAPRKWMWIIGDDDEPVDDSFSLISNIHEGENCFLVKFNSTAGRFENNKIELDNLENFYKYSHDLFFFSNLIFLSNSIFNIDKIKPTLIESVRLINGLIPQFSIMLTNLRMNNQILILGENTIIKHGIPNNTDHWSPIDFMVSLSELTLLHNSDLEMQIVRNVISSHKANQNFYIFFFKYPFYFELKRADYWKIFYLGVARNFSGLKFFYFVILSVTVKLYYKFIYKFYGINR